MAGSNSSGTKCGHAQGGTAGYGLMDDQQSAEG